MFAALVLSLWLQAPAACADAPECRRQAAAAMASGDYELAHDLAWRAMQKGKPADPESMLVLARAQALSGRPGDALVMLGRLADLGKLPDVVSDPDFRRVRALSGWPEFEARSSGHASAPSAPLAPSAPPAPAPLAPPASLAPSAPSASPSPPPDTLLFSAPGIEPFALAHDAVSRRFVLGDRHAHRLLVVDDVSRNVVNFVSAASAGFYDQLTAFTIDARRGDLWVASARGEESGSASVVHKLQLVSGRTLMEARAPERSGPVRFVGVAVMPDGTIYAVDARGGRLFRLRPGARTFELVMRVQTAGIAALAAADDEAIYVAGAKGVVRVDPAAHTATQVKSAQNLDGFQSLAWRAGALVGVQRTGDSFLVVRIRLDSAGTHATSRQVLASSSSPSVGALAGDSYYYLSESGAIRRLSLR